MATLPTNAQEAFRWTDLAALTAAAGSARGAAASADGYWLDLAGPRIVFVDGVYAPERSTPGHVALSPLTLDTAHPLGVQASGAAGWSIDLSAAEIVDPVQIVDRKSVV